MNEFEKTEQRAEERLRQVRKENDYKYCTSEIYSSTGHLSISIGKLVENLNSDDIAANKEHIDNLYYHIGKIKGLL